MSSVVGRLVIELRDLLIGASSVAEKNVDCPDLRDFCKKYSAQADKNRPVATPTASTNITMHSA
jgi:hypothetical protein